MDLNLPFSYTFIKKLDLGLTNNNYLVEMNDEVYIVRMPINDAIPSNRENEHAVLHAIKALDFIIEPIYYKNGIQISHYYPQLITFDDYLSPDRIIESARLMKKLHESKRTVEHHFNPVAMIHTYLKHTHNHRLDISLYNDLFAQYASHQFTPVLCHNDWVAGNICFLDHKTYLIDFEYAGMNDPLFDVMSFITENDLSEGEKKLFLTQMVDDLSENNLQVLMMYRDLNNLLWYLWACMMLEHRKDKIYAEIKAIKYKQLTMEYKQPLSFL